MMVIVDMALVATEQCDTENIQEQLSHNTTTIYHFTLVRCFNKTHRHSKSLSVCISVIVFLFGTYKVLEAHSQVVVAAVNIFILTYSV